MKGTFRILPFCLILAGMAFSQEVFDLLRKGDVAAVKALVGKTPGLAESRDANGLTLLHYAANGTDPGLIDFLIDKGAKIDLTGGQTKTPLHIAAANDRREIVGALVKRGASLEVKDDYGRTALILCARERGQAATARILIDAGADVNAVDKFGSDALELAAWRGKAEFIDLLLEKGAKVPESGQKWAAGLSQAASKCLAALFERLTAKGQDLKNVDPSGTFLLHSAVAGGSPRIVGAILDKGFDPARANRLGWTPLHYAALNGRSDAARLLLDRGAPIDARTVMGQTAYNVAIERGMTEIAKLLIEKGADRSSIRFPELKGDYLGQKPPGEKAELFASGIISSIWGLHSTVVFSPDGNEVYWAPMVEFPDEIYSRGGLMMMKRVDGRWTAPAWASFSGPKGEDDVPCFSADGKKLYFMCPAPAARRGTEGGREDMVCQPDAGRLVRSSAAGFQRQFGRKTLAILAWPGRQSLFRGAGADSVGLQDIYFARFKDGKYEKPASLGKPVNSTAQDHTPFVAPNGSYLLFSRQYDIWVSFRTDGGAWTEPVKMGPEVNSPSIELCPMVTADGKYLFFLSQRDGESYAYWVGAGVIEKMRPSVGSAGARDIFDAVKKNDLAAAKAIIEKDASLVSIKDSSGNTPLHTAAITGSVPMADWLLSRGADINADNLASGTPLLEAIRNTKDEMALFLIDKGADIEKNGGALVWAALRNRAAVAERLIAKGADIEHKRGEYTPLGNSVRMGQFDVTELLVRKGADLNVRDSLGNTPLDNAVIYGSEDNRAIDLLLDRSAEVNTDPASLRTTLSAAARRGHPRLFDYYCARGGEPLFADESNRRTFMRSAILGGSLEIVKKIQVRNIPLDFSANAAGLTPLHTLASNPRAVGMIGFLARNGADINARTNDGRSAYNIAEAKGNREAMTVLVKLGASTEAQKFPVLRGPYLGQTPPRDELKAFAPGIIAQDHGTIAFSPDGQEVYWPTGTAIMMMKIQDGRWTQPAYAPFSGPRDIPFYDDVPFVTPDNKRLFFTSLRPVSTDTSRKENIWFVERAGMGWSEPQPAETAVNAMTLHWQVSVSRSGALYFAGQKEKDHYGRGDIYCSRLIDGRYGEPVNLGPAINTGDSESQPFIAPDESFILFWRAPGTDPLGLRQFQGTERRMAAGSQVRTPLGARGADDLSGRAVPVRRRPLEVGEVPR